MLKPSPGGFMTPIEFIHKWRDAALSERSACQQHFLDLCELVGHPKPAEVDKTGESFTFERGAAKTDGGDGWADVWKRGFFGWEYKGRHANLAKAYGQLLQYREALENPPLLVVCDMDRLEIHTNFTGTRTEVHALRLVELDMPRSREILHALFFDPEKLRPGATSAAITTEAAAHIGEIAQRLRARGEQPAQVARFLDRLVFCLFAEDIGLLPEALFSRLLHKTRDDPPRFQKLVSDLFEAMAKGGDFGMDTIRWFNGSLFAHGPVLPLEEGELAILDRAAALDWSAVDASIFGTLFERGLDPDKRSQLGAHYTSRADIEALVEPVVMAPLRRRWKEVRARAEEALAALDRRPGRKALTPQAAARIRDRASGIAGAFLFELHTLTVLDPACGSGNFLYVTLQKLKDLEKEVGVWAVGRGLGQFLPMVHPHQLYGIEVNPYAHELAQMTVWIGYLQWISANGFGLPHDPVLESLEGHFLCRDAILDLGDPDHPKEPEWPEADCIVGNPPFLGDKLMRGRLGDRYVEELRRLYTGRIPGKSNLCCYWFERARAEIERGRCGRAGLLATQTIRQGANRQVLERIQDTGGIFFAESDRDWILDGASVHVSMVGFDSGSETERTLDSRRVSVIPTNLTSSPVVITTAQALSTKSKLAFIGTTKKGPLDVGEPQALSWLGLPNPHGRPNSDVLRPLVNSRDLTGRTPPRWVVDFDEMQAKDAALYEQPFAYLREKVFPLRVNHRESVQREFWWRLARPCPEMRTALVGLNRFLVTPTTSKHRVFAWVASTALPDHKLVVFATSSDYLFGTLQSHHHEIWALGIGSQHRERESGFTYTPTTCFETFPFPWPPGQEPADDPRVKAIADAARELDRLREGWLNPPEWTREEILTFPGSAEGPWGRFVTEPDARGIGTVRYPRLVPRDEVGARALKARTLTALYNQRPTWLANAHQTLDAAVASAYAWPPDLPDDQILQRLLALNRERAEGLKP